MSNEKELEELARAASEGTFVYHNATQRYEIILAALKKSQAMEREKWEEYAEHRAYCDIGIAPDRKCTCGLTELQRCETKEQHKEGAD